MPVSRSRGSCAEDNASGGTFPARLSCRSGRFRLGPGVSRCPDGDVAMQGAAGGWRGIGDAAPGRGPRTDGRGQMLKFGEHLEHLAHVGSMCPERRGISQVLGSWLVSG